MYITNLSLLSRIISLCSVVVASTVYQFYSALVTMYTAYFITNFQPRDLFRPCSSFVHKIIIISRNIKQAVWVMENIV
jgi:hypothetical protein